MQDYVKDVCKIGQGNACCRYLMAGTKGFECGKIGNEGPVETLEDKIKKGRPPFFSAKQLIDAKVERGEMVAISDNCEGKNPIP